MMTLLLALLAAFAFSPPAVSETILVHAGTLLAVPGSDPVTERTLVIRDGKTAEIRDGFVSSLPGEDVALINLSDRFVMPGFIDLHVHLTGQSGDDSRAERITKSDAHASLRAAMYAKRTLMAGFTTVRNLGSRGEAMFALRDAIAAGHVTGPKILVAGYSITPTGGHADVHGYRAEISAVLASSGVCDGPDDCRRAVRLQVKRGADVIKVTATGGVLSNTNSGTGQQFTDDELRAIAETAHALGRKVTAHAHDKPGIDAALRAGFDSIEHSMWADSETMTLFKETGAWLIPTVYPITYVGDTPKKMKQGPFRNLPPASMEKLLRLGQKPRDMTKLAHEMGVRIALGTDSGVSPHGHNAREFLEYVAIGMTPMEALMAGTVNAAEAGGIPGVGALAPGMAADLVAMSNSPLRDIEEVLRLTFIMGYGIVFKKER